jgi:hypothetical protein
LNVWSLSSAFIKKKTSERKIITTETRSRQRSGSIRSIGSAEGAVRISCKLLLALFRVCAGWLPFVGLVRSDAMRFSSSVPVKESQYLKDPMEFCRSGESAANLKGMQLIAGENSA